MNLIFDFDGTICDSFNTGINIVKNNFPEYYSEDITPEIARDIGFKGLLKISKFPKYKLPKFAIAGRREMAKAIPNLKTFPHIKVVIKKLARENTLGIITSNSEDNARKFLKNNKLEKHFYFVYSSLAVFGKHKKLFSTMKKYGLNPKETLYIGDETRDIEAATKAGIKSVAVTWGYESEKVLVKAKPDYIIRSPKELITKLL